jgi:hypothetical protein
VNSFPFAGGHIYGAERKLPEMSVPICAAWLDKRLKVVDFDKLEAVLGAPDV